MIYKIYTFIIILENSMCWKWDELIEGKEVSEYQLVTIAHLQYNYSTYIILIFTNKITQSTHLILLANSSPYKYKYYSKYNSSWYIKSNASSYCSCNTTEKYCPYRNIYNKISCPLLIFFFFHQMLYLLITTLFLILDTLPE